MRFAPAAATGENMRRAHCCQFRHQIGRAVFISGQRHSVTEGPPKVTSHPVKATLSGKTTEACLGATANQDATESTGLRCVDHGSRQRLLPPTRRLRRAIQYKLQLWATGSLFCST